MVVEPLYICLNKNIYVTDIVSIHYVNVIGRRYTTKTKFFFFFAHVSFLIEGYNKGKVPTTKYTTQLQSIQVDLCDPFNYTNTHRYF